MTWFNRGYKAPRMSTTPKGAGWKTSMVPRVSMMSMVPRLSAISKGMPDKMVGVDDASKTYIFSVV